MVSCPTSDVNGHPVMSLAVYLHVPSDVTGI
eukprot:COSAG01_NODE_62364_length_285_cov_0.548387_2_plen_30_part_01